MGYYLYRYGDVEIHYDGTKNADGSSRGRVQSGTPIESSESLDELARHADAYLFRNPDETLYITEDDRVLDCVTNAPVAEWKERHSTDVSVLWVHIILLAVFVIASAFHAYGLAGLLVLGVVLFLYHVSWRLRIQNEIESGVVCMIILLLLLLLVPALQHARQKARELKARAVTTPAPSNRR
jgi:hypothetical protein